MYSYIYKCQESILYNNNSVKMKTINFALIIDMYIYM